ncbi:hypothetical protein CLF_109363 [Clonorchis sinensis]|uniref:Uncharacterized protein n=1 Tax=Clonorchis sinensis TaxID=79923 RepID=G7YSI7_CLOSI|nr:hypothetical protein CLF_109363 [Clonorchis sinensis]
MPPFFHKALTDEKKFDCAGRCIEQFMVDCKEQCSFLSQVFGLRIFARAQYNLRLDNKIWKSALEFSMWLREHILYEVKKGSHRKFATHSTSEKVNSTAEQRCTNFDVVVTMVAKNSP